MENDTQKEKNNTAIDILDQIKAKILSGKINVLDMETMKLLMIENIIKLTEVMRC